jgi:cytosine/adenosine deaminase-related metal-dependent hydrolase
LCGAHVALDAQSAVAADITIVNGRILRVTPRFDASTYVSPSDDINLQPIDLSGYLLLPGLINAHDHLEFGLFPKLGNGPYQNSSQWAKDIYHPDHSPIREHLAIPKVARLWWGAIKNLLSGVTTVCHHNEFRPDVFGDGFPVRAVRRYAWSHSFHFGGDLASAFPHGEPAIPYIIHLGEGIDRESATEIFELDHRGLLDSRTVIVHGVGLDDAGHDLLIERGAALIWCPESNLFTLGRTLPPDRVRQNPRVALGSDSPLTAGDLLDQIHTAHQLGASAECVFDLVTTRAANVLRLQDGEGTLLPQSVADIIAVPYRGLSPADALIQATVDQIELVFLAGMPRLLSEPMRSRFPSSLQEGFESIVVDGVERCIAAPVALLRQMAAESLGETIMLAGKKIQP